MENENSAALVEPVLADLAEAARRAFGTGLASVVLFGSAAENRLRASSDVNLMILLERVEQAALDAFREPLRAARAAIRAEVMILTRAELQAAAQLFPVKYSDMRARHRMLAGTDPFERLEIPEADLRRQTREILMNTALRLRERYVRLSIRDEQLVRVIADSAGPPGVDQSADRHTGTVLVAVGSGVVHENAVPIRFGGAHRKPAGDIGIVPVLIHQDPDAVVMAAALRDPPGGGHIIPTDIEE